MQSVVKKSNKTGELDDTLQSENLADSNEEVISLEYDVAGPLTLEEAKAVGDVPENFSVNQEEPSGFLQRAASFFTGFRSKSKSVISKNESISETPTEE